MWHYDHDILPVALMTYSQNTSTMHSYRTRMATQGKLFPNKVNTIKHGIKSFQYQGMKTLNDLKIKTFTVDQRVKHNF